MPKLSLYNPIKRNDYKFIDRNISEQLSAGATELYIHKYTGPALTTGTTTDLTQPTITVPDPTQIQDLLFLENRDRTYDTSVYRLRGHYSVQNLDFDLSQFGLFLNNDIIFIVVHYNDMIDIVGRKLMVGDVLELPHLMDYHPLKETIPTALKRFYQITDANYASEGFSATWYPHLWRIKCEPLVNSQEYSQILQAPVNQDNYMGNWSAGQGYPSGYSVSYGGKNYVSTAHVPAGVQPPDPAYWALDTAQTLTDILSAYNQNIAINDAALQEAERLVPKSGYDTGNLYVVPTYGKYSSNGVLSGKDNQPAPPVNISTSVGAPVVVGNVVAMRAGPALRIPAQSASSLSVSTNMESIAVGTSVSLEAAKTTGSLNSTGSGSIDGDSVLLVDSLGSVQGPFVFATSGGVSGSGATTYQYITRSSPRSFGYLAGYLTGTAEAPNGLPTGSGIAFPLNPAVGDYFLRIDYAPQLLYRWDGKGWRRISANVRTGTGFDSNDKSLLSGFINNSNTTELTNGTSVSEAQALSKILRIKPD